jgi:hypothetical protein
MTTEAVIPQMQERSATKTARLLSHVVEVGEENVTEGLPRNPGRCRASSLQSATETIVVRLCRPELFDAFKTI